MGENKNNGLTQRFCNTLLAEVKAGIHKQFIFNSEKERVECRCGHVAIWWKKGYLCGTITAYPCKFN